MNGLPAVTNCVHIIFLTATVLDKIAITVERRLLSRFFYSPLNFTFQFNDAVKKKALQTKEVFFFTTYTNTSDWVTAWLARVLSLLSTLLSNTQQLYKAV